MVARVAGRLVLASTLALTAILAGCGQFGTPGQIAMAPEAEDELLGADSTGTTGPLRAYFNDAYGETIEQNEPKARANPYNTDKSLFRIIRGARQSLDVAFYDLADLDVAKAFIAARRRGVKVRVVTDSDNMVDVEDGKARESIQLLKAAGIPVREDKRSAIMHQKIVIADRHHVWTGSTNATVRSLYQHNNNAVVVRSEILANVYTRVFEEYQGGSFGPSGDLQEIMDGSGIALGGMHIQPFFSPRGGGKAAVAAELAQARKNIKFMTFSLTDKEVGEILVQKNKAGIEVEGVFDRWLAAGEYSLYAPLKRRGLKVLKDGNQALMHHKVFVIDNEVVVTGSFNYSQNAEAANNENFLIIRNAPQIAKAYLSEFRKVQHAARYNHPPAFKPKDPEAGTGHQ